MENLALPLIRIVTHCCDVKTFRFALEEGISYKPGQYLVFTQQINGKELHKAFSISSSPTEKGYIEFTKKLTGSEFSRALDSLKEGDLCKVRLPMGKFTFTGEFERIAFLSGGIGITPIRSICKYATDMALSASLSLLYSSRTSEYLIFRDDFAAMQKQNKNLKVIYTLTACDEAVPGCRLGVIDERMVQEEIPDYLERKFFLCGPPAMVETMRSLLSLRLSVPPGNIITEDFVGY